MGTALLAQKMITQPQADLFACCSGFYFLYMACVCFGFFLMLGTVGFRASLFFVRHIYRCGYALCSCFHCPVHPTRTCHQSPADRQACSLSCLYEGETLSTCSISQQQMPQLPCLGDLLSLNQRVCIPAVMLQILGILHAVLKNILWIVSHVCRKCLIALVDAGRSNASRGK